MLTTGSTGWPAAWFGMMVLALVILIFSIFSWRKKIIEFRMEWSEVKCLRRRELKFFFKKNWKYQFFARANQNTSGLHESHRNYNVILSFGFWRKCSVKKKSSVIKLINKYTFRNSIFAKISVIFLMFWKVTFSDLSKIFEKMASN